MRERENKREWNRRVKLYMIWQIELHENLVNNNVRNRNFKCKINFLPINEVLKKLISLEILVSDSQSDFLSLNKFFSSSHWHENIVVSRQFVDV